MDLRKLMMPEKWYGATRWCRPPDETMKLEVQRAIDRYAGVPICALLSIVEERLDMGQRIGVAHQAARCCGISRLGATCHGSGVSMRLIGCVAMRSST